MNEQQLRDELQVFYDNFDEIGVSIYAILKNSDNAPIKVDIENTALKGLKSLFVDSIKKTVTDREELRVLNLSTSDERLDAIYLYDVDMPEELSSIETVIASDNLPLMNIADTNISDIKALLIEIGNNIGQIVLYKTLAPVNVYGRSSFFLKKSQTRLEQISDEFLRITPNFQLMRVKDSLFVLDLKAIEKSFGFDEVIKREAALGISAIEATMLVENSDVLRELLDDIRYARRFTKVAKASPVLKARIPNTDIINFCKTFTKLAGKIRFNASEDKILLDTKISKDLFIKVLMDDFLTSELTKFHYESVAKDSLDENIENTTSED